MRRRLVTLVLSASLLGTGLTGAAAADPDPAYPSGTFSLPTTTGYVHDNDYEHYQRASVDLGIGSITDDVTPAAEIVTRIYSGTDLGYSSNGDIIPPGTTRTTIDYGGGLYDDPFPYFALAGTYQPYVTLTDSDGHVTRIDLPTVTLLNDHTPPVPRLTVPPRSKRSTMLAWRHPRGTVVDAGISRPTDIAPGSAYAQVLVLQKRRGYWYAYDCYTAGPRPVTAWCKGKRTLAATLKKFRAPGISTSAVGRSGWRSPYIRGLTRGPLAIQVYGGDINLNGTSRLYTGFTITRRR